MKKIILLQVAVLLGLNLHSQDLHFSQFNQAPSLLNPALTGASTVLRASVIYKDQWRSVTVPYKTYGASFEMKFKASNWDRVDKFKTKTYKRAFNRVAGGLSFYSDKAGDGNMGSTQVNLSLATFIPTGRTSALSVGLQASMVQRSIQYSKLLFPNQFDGASYDPNISNMENAAIQSFIYPDFAGGILWSYGYNERSIAANNEFRANVGAAVYHINEPRQEWLQETTERINPKFVLHGDFLIGIRNSNVGIAPTYMVEIQRPSTEVVVGSYIKYYFKDDSKYTGFIKRSDFGIGAFYRSNDAFIVAGIVEFGQYAIGVSYDLNTSQLTKASTGRGGMEIFIRFVTPNPFLYQKKSNASFL
jgi:type IX secretion system PorP/SprF family membrane protein